MNNRTLIENKFIEYIQFDKELKRLIDLESKGTNTVPERLAILDKMLTLGNHLKGLLLGKVFISARGTCIVPTAAGVEFMEIFE